LRNEGKLSGPAARSFSLPTRRGERYDLQKDPPLLNNLAGDAAYARDLGRLRAECGRWMLETGDLGLLPEYEMQIRSRAATPWEIAVDRSKNPLADLLKAADLANRREPGNLPELVKYLENKDAALRWWGAQGLVALGAEARPAESALNRALNDESPAVRVAAAEALGNLGRYDAALPILISGLQHEMPVIRLTALNVLDRFGARAAPALPAIRAAKSPGKDHLSDYVNRMVEYLPAQLEARIGQKAQPR